MATMVTVCPKFDENTGRRWNPIIPVEFHFETRNYPRRNTNQDVLLVRFVIEYSWSPRVTLQCTGKASMLAASISYYFTEVVPFRGLSNPAQNMFPVKRVAASSCGNAGMFSKALFSFFWQTSSLMIGMVTFTSF